MSATLDGGVEAAGKEGARTVSKGTYVDKMKEGDGVKGHFVVISKSNEPARYKDKEGMYFFFEIGDKTGTIDVKYWGGKDEGKTVAVHRSFKAGDVVLISNGGVKMYKGRREVNMSADRGASVSRVDEYKDMDELVQPGKDIDGMVERLRAVIRSVRDSDVRTALDAVFDEKMIADFAAAPAAVRYHHGYAGGLLEHSLSMAAVARTVAEQHGDGIDGDLLVAGCLLHDIGKTKGYRIGTIIERTEGEIMLGHIPVGARIVEEAIAKAGGVPDTVRDKLVHMVLSHHGALEKGSPVEPLFPEAMALHKIDDCDAQVKHAVTEKRDAVKSAPAAAGGGAGSARLVRGDKGRGYVYIG